MHTSQSTLDSSLRDTVDVTSFDTRATEQEVKSFLVYKCSTKKKIEYGKIFLVVENCDQGVANSTENSSFATKRFTHM